MGLLMEIDYRKPMTKFEIELLKVLREIIGEIVKVSEAIIDTAK